MIHYESFWDIFKNFSYKKKWYNMKNTCIPFGFCKLALRRQNENLEHWCKKENEKLSHVENKRPSSSNGGIRREVRRGKPKEKEKKNPKKKKKVRRSFGTKPIPPKISL